MKKRLLSSLLTMALLAATLSGCGSSAEESVSSAKPQEEAVSSEAVGEADADDEADKPYAGTKIVINLNTVSDSIRDDFDAWVSHIKERVLDETGIEVEVEMVAWADYLNKHLASIASQEGPDIIQMGSSVPPVMAAADGLLDLTPYMDDFGGRDVYTDVAKYYCTWDEKMIGIPWGGGGRNMYYNKDLFDAAGLEYPEFDWTYEEFENDLKVLTEYMGKPAFGTMGTGNDASYYFMAQLVSNGGSVLNDDMTAAAFNDQTGVDTVMALLDLYNKGYLLPSFAENGIDEQIPPMINGDIAVATGNTSWGGELESNMKANFGAVPYPEGKAGLPNGIITMSAFGIMKYTKNPEAAVEVLKILGSPEETVTSTVIQKWVPFRTDIMDDPAYDSNPLKDTFFYISQNSKSYVPQYQAISTVLNSLTKCLNEIYMKAVTDGADEAYVKEHLDSCAEEVNNIIAAN